MKILQITHYMPPHQGGIERVADALRRGLSARGHEVHWISSATPAPAGDTGAETRVAAWNVLEERLGMPYPLWSPRALAAVVARVRWADVVHVHDCLYPGSVAAAAACRVTGRPLLVTQHVARVPFGRAVDRLQGLAYRTVGRFTLAAARARVACSPHVAAYFAGLAPRLGFEVVPNAVDAGRFAPATAQARAAARARLGLAADDRVLLFVGRLVPKKGIAKVAAAQRALAAGGSRLLVVGDGPLAPLLADVPGVVRVPALPPERMPEAYAAADGFVLPSEGEGFPVSVQEAMLSGLGVVVSEDPAFVANLRGAPGAVLARDEAALVEAARATLAAPPAPGAVRAFAAARWRDDAFVGAYEALLGRLAARARPAAEGATGG